jgi:hypothetical protein
MQSDGTIRNTYEIRLRNMQPFEHPFRISVTAEPGVQEHLHLTIEDVVGNVVTVPADATQPNRIYIDAEPGSDPATERRSEIRLWVEDLTGHDRVSVDTVFNGKED